MNEGLSARKVVYLLVHLIDALLSSRLSMSESYTSLNFNLHIFSRESSLKSTEICTSSTHPSSYLSHLSALTTFSQFSSVTQLCLTLCDPMDHSTPGLPIHHQLPEFTQTQVQWVGDATQPSHSLLSPSPPAFNLSQHQGLFQWVSSLHQFSSVQSLSRVRLFVTWWIEACQASLSITISWSQLKLMSIQSVIPSNHLILCCPLLLLLSIFPRISISK